MRFVYRTECINLMQDKGLCNENKTCNVYILKNAMKNKMLFTAEIGILFNNIFTC